MIDYRKLKNIFDKDISESSFEDNCYNNEDFFETSINTDFAGWYDKSDILKKGKFIVDKCQLKRDDRILDLACGHGKYSEYFLKHGLKVTAADISVKLINYLKKTYPAITFYKRRMEDISFDDNYNSIVILGNSLSLVNKNKCTLILNRMYQEILPKCKVLIELDNIVKFIKEEAGVKNWNYHDNRWLVISEHYYDEKNKLEKTRDIGIDFKNNSIDETIFVKQLYYKDEFTEMIKSIGFKNIKIFGDWIGNRYNDNSNQMIFLLEKY